MGAKQSSGRKNYLVQWTEKTPFHRWIIVELGNRYVSMVNGRPRNGGKLNLPTFFGEKNKIYIFGKKPNLVKTKLFAKTDFGKLKKMLSLLFCAIAGQLGHCSLWWELGYCKDRWTNSCSFGSLDEWTVEVVSSTGSYLKQYLLPV